MRDDRQEEHETPILWQAKSIAEARFTSRPEWSTAGESMWMRLSKFSLCNRLTLHELSNLVLLPPKQIPTNGVDLRRADRFDPARLSDLLKISPMDVRTAFCYSTPGLTNASTELRYCRECLQQGFHAAWFQWRSSCVVHCINAPSGAVAPVAQGPFHTCFRATWRSIHLFVRDAASNGYRTCTSLPGDARRYRVARLEFCAGGKLTSPNPQRAFRNSRVDSTIPRRASS